MLVPVVLATALFASQGAYAFPSCGSHFAARYSASTTDDLAGCQTCHQSASGGNNFNVYGSELLAKAGDAGVSACSDTGFTVAAEAAEGVDSDGEGHSNLVEINDNKQPGWCSTAKAGCI